MQHRTDRQPGRYIFPDPPGTVGATQKDVNIIEKC